MSLLSKRVQKADNLNFTDIPGLTKTTQGATKGSAGAPYRVSLFQKKEWEKIQVGDVEIKAIVIAVHCQSIDHKNGNGLNPMCDCPGNKRHTVCYHCLGFLKWKLAQRNKNVSFFEDAKKALNGLNFGGQLAKVVSKQGDGHVWAVIKNKPKILSAKKNIALMRGNEDDEGIE